VAGIICSLAVALKFRLGFDDSLDVVAVHLFGGIVGTLLIGFFGTTSVNALSANGFFYGGGWTQLGKQAIAAGSVMAYSFILTMIIGLLIKYTIKFRVPEEAEIDSIDEALHAESGYDFSTLGGGGRGASGSLGAPPTAKVPATAGKEG
jgi:Amt family ammonium transporter